MTAVSSSQLSKAHSAHTVTPRLVPVDLDQEHVTLGAMIAIPEPWNEQLSAWRARAGDPLANLVLPHVTLIPPTTIGTDELDLVLAQMSATCEETPGFTLDLRGTGTFRPISDVVFVAVSRGISECELLAQQLRQGPFDTPLNFPYHPHVTVAQNVASEFLDEVYECLEDFKANFVVDHIALHRQNANGSWDQIARFALAKENPSHG